MLADLRKHGARRPARRARHRAVRAGRGRTSTRSPTTVAVRRDAGRVRRADRHRRPDDGARGGQEPPERRGRRLPGAVRRGARGGRGRRLHPRAAAAGSPLEAFRHTASYDIAVASWMGSVLAPDPSGAASPAGSARRGTRERGAALRREPAPAGGAVRRASTPPPGLAQAEQLHGKEMSYNNYVDADAARRAAYDFDRAGRRDHQAREPVRHRGRRRHRRRATARRTTATRCRRSAGVIATNRPVTRGDGRGDRRRVHRGRRRARRSTTRRWRS